VYSPKP